MWDPKTGLFIDQATGKTITASSSATSSRGGDTGGSSISIADGMILSADNPNPAASLQSYSSVLPPSESLNVQDFLESCGRNKSDKMTLVTTKCDYNVNVMTCQQLSAAQLLPSGSVSFSPTAASGNFTAPLGCGYSPVLLGYDGSYFYFSAQRTPVLAVIARDAGSKAFFFGTGAMQVRGSRRGSINGQPSVLVHDSNRHSIGHQPLPAFVQHGQPHRHKSH